MLVLSRKLGESIMIGDGIVITLLDVVNGKVKLGINAPKEVAIRREENLTEEQRRNIRAKS